MPFSIGPTELIIFLVVVMMVFGVGKLPQVGSSIGQAIREFRRAQNNEDSQDTKEPVATNNESGRE